MVNPSSKLAKFMKEPLKVTFDFLGDNPNSAIGVAVTIAAFKGIFRPIFTMRDKHTDPDKKKSAAIREFLTEVIAIPVYLATPVIIEKAIINKVFKNETAHVLKNIKTNSKFLSVCLSTALIPAVCNLIQPPIMAAYKKSQDAKKAEMAEATTPTSINKPAFTGKLGVKTQNPLVGKINYGMRVGN